MWIYLLQGIGYGLAAASQPGPFQTYIISQTLTRGWKRTLPAALAPLVSDGPIILLCCACAQPGTCVAAAVSLYCRRIVYFISRLRHIQSHGKTLTRKPTSQNPRSGQSVLKAALMNALNPNPYIFWTLVTGPILLKGWRETPVNGIGFLAGFYITMIGSLAAIILVFGTAVRLGPKVNRVLLGISAIALFCFGLYQLWLGIFPK